MSIRDLIQKAYLETVNIQNPFEISVEETIRRLRRQDEADQLGISEQGYVILAATAPEWPKGAHSYRSLRIRFGKGMTGIDLTKKQHFEILARVFGKSFDLTKRATLHNGLRTASPIRSCSLYGGSLGDRIHLPTVEWVIVDDIQLQGLRSCPIENLQNPRSAADEGLVLGWLFPERVRAVDFNCYFPIYCGGYCLNAPCGRGTGWDLNWQMHVCVSKDPDTGVVTPYTEWDIRREIHFSVLYVRDQNRSSVN